MEGIGFVQAGCLQEGYELKCLDGKKETITGIRVEWLEEAITVYNFEVADYHTYYVGDGDVLVHNKCANPSGSDSNTSGDSKITRRQAINLAKDRAGIPRSQQPIRQWTVGNDIYKKGGTYSNYEFSENLSHHGRYYEYETPNGRRVIVDHTNDIEQGLHVHAGQPPMNEINPYAYDFKNPDNSYYPIGGTHHIYYK